MEWSPGPGEGTEGTDQGIDGVCRKTLHTLYPVAKEIAQKYSLSHEDFAKSMTKVPRNFEIFSVLYMYPVFGGVTEQLGALSYAGVH